MDKYDIDEYTLDRNRGERHQVPLKLIDPKNDPVEDIMGPAPTEEELRHTFWKIQRRLCQLEIAIRIQNAILFLVAGCAICSLVWFLVEIL